MLEVEAGRGARGNAVYRDLIRTSLIVDVQFLALGVMTEYRHLSGGRPTVVRSFHDPASNSTQYMRVGSCGCPSRVCFSSVIEGRSLPREQASRTLRGMSDALAQEAAAFLSPARLYNRAEILSRPCPVPASPGVYGWWFRRLPTTIDITECRSFGADVLLYTGISPRRPPAIGRAASRESIRSRIRTHLAGNAEGSTLRKTLGCLLADQLGIELRRVGSGTRMTFLDGEQALSAWIAANARVAWIVRSQPWELEDYLIQAVDLPLNLHGTVAIDSMRSSLLPALRLSREPEHSQSGRTRESVAGRQCRPLCTSARSRLSRTSTAARHSNDAASLRVRERATESGWRT